MWTARQHSIILLLLFVSVWRWLIAVFSVCHNLKRPLTRALAFNTFFALFTSWCMLERVVPNNDDPYPASQLASHQIPKGPTWFRTSVHLVRQRISDKFWMNAWVYWIYPCLLKNRPAVLPPAYLSTLLFDFSSLFVN